MSKEIITDYKCTGIITKEELKEANLLPPESIFKTKRVAFLECVESIPCDACRFSCSFDAIIIFHHLFVKLKKFKFVHFNPEISNIHVSICHLISNV